LRVRGSRDAHDKARTRLGRPPLAASAENQDGTCVSEHFDPSRATFASAMTYDGSTDPPPGRVWQGQLVSQGAPVRAYDAYASAPPSDRCGICDPQWQAEHGADLAQVVVQNVDSKRPGRTLLVIGGAGLYIAGLVYLIGRVCGPRPQTA